MKFQLGDVVQLKSGGPSMTISSYQEPSEFHDGLYCCQWFRGASKERGNFEEHELKTYVAPAKL